MPIKVLYNNNQYQQHCVKTNTQNRGKILYHRFTGGHETIQENYVWTETKLANIGTRIETSHPKSMCW